MILLLIPILLIPCIVGCIKGYFDFKRHEKGKLVHGRKVPPTFYIIVIGMILICYPTHLYDVYLEGTNFFAVCIYYVITTAISGILYSGSLNLTMNKRLGKSPRYVGTTANYDSKIDQTWLFKYLLSLIMGISFYVFLIIGF